MKSLIVVAHSDDHILWAGGTILRFNMWEWHIISLCNSHDSNFKSREDTFKQSCEILKIKKYKALDLEDYQCRKSEQEEKCQIGKIKEGILAFAGEEYDLIFTHSVWPTCEYDFHANHFETRSSMDELISKNLLSGKGIFNFCFKSGGYQQPVIADIDRADYKIELTENEINKKRRLKDIFSWAREDLKNLSLLDNDEPRVEAFNLQKLFDIELPVDFIKITKL